MNASFSSAPSQDYYDRCKNEMGQGIGATQWLMYRERSQGVEWKVIGKPIWIVKVIYKLLGWNHQIQNVSNRACLFFTAYKDQGYFDANSANHILSRLMQKCGLGNSVGKSLANLNVEIQRKSEQKRISQTTQFGASVISIDVVNYSMSCFLNSDDKKTLGLVSKTFRALVQQQPSPANYLSRILVSTMPGKPLSVRELQLSFNLSFERQSFDPQFGEPISFESFKELFPEKFNFQRALEEFFKLNALIVPNSNEEKFLIYLMKHIPWDVSKAPTTRWIEGSNVQPIIRNLQMIAKGYSTMRYALFEAMVCRMPLKTFFFTNAYFSPKRGGQHKFLTDTCHHITDSLSPNEIPLGVRFGHIKYITNDIINYNYSIRTVKERYIRDRFDDTFMVSVKSFISYLEKKEKEDPELLNNEDYQDITEEMVTDITADQEQIQEMISEFTPSAHERNMKLVNQVGATMNQMGATMNEMETTMNEIKFNMNKIQTFINANKENINDVTSEFTPPADEND